MVESKYGHLIKTDFIRKGIKNAKTGSGEFTAWPVGKEMGGLDINYCWGVRSKPGDLIADQKGLHVHPQDECLLFSSLDYNNRDLLGAEIEMVIGDNAQKFVMTSPAIITIPHGTAHSVPVIKSVSKPFGFEIMSLAADHKATRIVEGNSKKSEQKYSSLVKPMEMKDMKRTSGGNADFITGMGGKNLENFQLNFTWAFHTGLGLWHEQDPHVHSYAEILVFVGLDPQNPGSLGAEIEIAMGEELEKHVFDTPTIVAVPGGLAHCPLDTKRVDKPYGFSAICLNAEHDTKWLGKKKTSS